MRENEHDSEKYLLPYETGSKSITKMLPILLAMLFCLSIPGFPICIIIRNIIRDGIEKDFLNNFLCIILFGSFFVFFIYIFTFAAHTKMVIDFDRMEICSILRTKVIYWDEIENLNTWVIKPPNTRYNRGYNIGKFIKLTYRKKGSHKKKTVQIGTTDENCEILKNTIWYAYAKYHPECRQGIE